jgi:DNA gyrase subunit B
VSIEDIEVLPGWTAIRKRAEMYVGPLDSPETLNHLIEQVLCGSLDEAISGKCSKIEITLGKNEVITVEDDGPGMKIESIHGKSSVEMLMTVLHACRAMRNNPQAKDFCSSGLAVVNALSEDMRVDVKRDGRMWSQSYREGEPLGPLEDLGPSKATGLKFRFRLDPKILKVRQIDAASLMARLAEIVTETEISTRLNLIDQR